jgi:hypothetical protein
LKALSETLGSWHSEKQRVELKKRKQPNSRKSHNFSINKEPKLFAISFGFFAFKR